MIIEEVSLPTEEKTIKPVDVGGIAGGIKYISNNILFKFSLDFKGIYGGDEGAMVFYLFFIFFSSFFNFFNF